MQGMNSIGGIPGANNTAQNIGQQVDLFFVGDMPPFGMYRSMRGKFEPAMK